MAKEEKKRKKGEGKKLAERKRPDHEPMWGGEKKPKEERKEGCRTF